MKFQKTLPILALSLFSVSAFAKSHVAQVEQLRGHVTQLKPGARVATPVLLGDQIEEDTSVVTGEKSFVRIKFTDGSLLNLGPAGKVVVAQMPSEGAGVVSLLKGTLRTQVEKNRNSKEGENKFYIKTRSAAMGVRGTDFQTVYNPENKMTSLLTFKGEVAMANVKDEPTKVSVKTVRVNNQDVEVEAPVKKVDDQLQQKSLDKALKAKQTVLVKPGQFSGTVQKLETVSKPVKISPVQLDALYKNQELESKGDDASALDTSKNIKDETKKVISESTLVQAEQEAPPEGFFNAKTKEFAPKSGGFIDLKTGLYVPPSADSEFDAQRKIYIPSKVGSVDTKTGEYVAPEGLKLDAKNGFVVDKIKMAEMDESKKVEASKTLVAMTQDLNKTIAKDLILAPEGAKSEYRLAFVPYSPRETFTKNIVSVALTKTNDAITYSGMNDSGLNRKMKSNGGSGVAASWYLNSDGVVQPLAEFSLRDIEYSEGGIRQNNTRLFNMAVGGRYYVSDALNLVAKVALEQNHFLTYTLDSNGGSSTTTTPEFKVVTVPKFKGGLSYTLVDLPRFQTFTDLGAIVTAPRDSADFSLKAGAGFYARLALRANFSQKIWGQMAFALENENQKASDKTSPQKIQRSSGTFDIRLGGTF